jgi:hypothetical protein
MVIVAELQDMLGKMQLDETDAEYERRVDRLERLHGERHELSPVTPKFIPPKQRRDRSELKRFLDAALPMLNMPGAAIVLVRQGFKGLIRVIEPGHAPAGKRLVLVVPWNSRWDRIERACGDNFIEQPKPQPAEPDDEPRRMPHPNTTMEFLIC